MELPSKLYTHNEKQRRILVKVSFTGFKLDAGKREVYLFFSVDFSFSGTRYGNFQG